MGWQGSNSSVSFIRSFGAYCWCHKQQQLLQTGHWRRPCDWSNYWSSAPPPELPVLTADQVPHSDTVTLPLNSLLSLNRPICAQHCRCSAQCVVSRAGHTRHLCGACVYQRRGRSLVRVVENVSPAQQTALDSRRSWSHPGLLSLAKKSCGAASCCGVLIAGLHDSALPRAISWTCGPRMLALKSWWVLLQQRMGLSQKSWAPSRRSFSIEWNWKQKAELSKRSIKKVGVGASHPSGSCC